VHRIRLNEAQVDMVLAADVTNAQQMLLLKKGAHLTSQHLRMFKSWGIDSLYVQMPAYDNAVDAKATANTTDLETETRSRFTDDAENPIESEICRVAAEIIHTRPPLKG